MLIFFSRTVRQRNKIRTKSQVSGRSNRNVDVPGTRTQPRKSDHTKVVETCCCFGDERLEMAVLVRASASSGFFVLYTVCASSFLIYFGVCTAILLGVLYQFKLNKIAKLD